MSDAASPSSTSGTTPQPPAQDLQDLIPYVSFAPEKRPRGRPRKNPIDPNNPPPEKEKKESVVDRRPVPIETSKTVDGVSYQILKDEMLLPNDVKGSEKIDANGNLLGGREFKLPTFTFPFRQNTTKVFILAIDAARATGYRDSLYFFRRNPLVHKIVCTQAEKDFLIDKGILHTNLRGRSVTMVSALNLFKALGAKMVKEGKHVIDDYYEEEALAKGYKYGQPATTEAYEPGKHDGIMVGVGPRGVPTPSYTHVRGELVFGEDGAPPFFEDKAEEVKGEDLWTPLKQGLDPHAWKYEYMKACVHTNRWLADVRREGREVVWLGADAPGDREEGREDEYEEVEVYDVEEESNDKVKTNGRSRKGKRKRKTSSVIASRSPSPAPLSLPIIKRRRHVSPPYGRFEPHTNIAHVPTHTQPVGIHVERLELYPRLKDAGNGEGEEREPERRAASKLGVWSVSVEIKADEGEWSDVWIEGGGKE